MYFSFPIRIQKDTDTDRKNDPHSLTLTGFVVKKRIKTSKGHPADYTGAVNSDGAPHGHGSWEVVEGVDRGDKYEGDFNDGKREGLGKLSSNDGRIWQGEFKGNNLDGFVKVVLLRCDLNHSLQFKNAEGDVSEGLFKDGKSHGLETV
jgi:hypothetical protein